MELTEMERENMIWALTEYELKWLLDNPNKHNVTDLADFFAKGGLSKYSDADLQEVYDMKFKEEACKRTTRLSRLLTGKQGAQGSWKFFPMEMCLQTIKISTGVMSGIRAVMSLLSLNGSRLKSQKDTKKGEVR